MAKLVTHCCLLTPQYGGDIKQEPIIYKYQQGWKHFFISKVEHDFETPNLSRVKQT
jgi:hypothetical protein